MNCPHCNGTGRLQDSVSADSLSYAASRIARMGYFPGSDPNAKSDVIEELAAMANRNEQVIWFAQQFPRAYKDWPGLKEMRAFFCRGYRPADGQRAESEMFGEAGIPRELLGNPPGKTNLLPIAELKALPPARGEIETSVNPELCDLVHEIAVASNLPTVRKPRSAAEIEKQLYGKPASSGSFESQLSKLEGEVKRQGAE